MRVESALSRLVRIMNTALLTLLRFLSTSSEHYVTVLLYHSVDTNGSSYAVTPTEFLKQLEYLRRNFTIVSLKDLLEFVEGKREMPKRSVAITFDDGYHDNYANVYPYTRRYGLPISIFVITGFVGKEMPLGDVQLKMLSWEEIVEMSQHNVTIGAHTKSHPKLTQLALDEAEDEISQSKAEIELKIGQGVDLFAYPKGAYSNLHPGLLKSLGFAAALSTDRGVVRRGDDCYTLRRVSIGANTGFLTFKAGLTAGIDWYTRIENAGTRLRRMIWPRFVE